MKGVVKNLLKLVLVKQVLAKLVLVKTGSGEWGKEVFTL